LNYNKGVEVGCVLSLTTVVLSVEVESESSKTKLKRLKETGKRPLLVLNAVFLFMV
jgi:hypothetical protein